MIFGESNLFSYLRKNFFKKKEERISSINRRTRADTIILWQHLEN